MADGTLAELVTAYLDRVVNEQDLSGVEELVSPAYTGAGPGWPTSREALRQFYAEQSVERPDWRIDVDATLELGDVVVVRARAGGTVTADGSTRRRDVEWLAAYRVEQHQIREIRLLSLVER